MRFYIINLTKDADRLDFMKSQLDTQKLEYTIVRAIEGNSLSPAQLDFFKNFKQMSLYPNEFACFLSHIEAWKAFLSSEEKAAIICEDDIVISPDTKNIIEQTIMEDDAPFVIRLETFLASVTLSARSTQIADRDIRLLYSNQAGAAGYMINRVTAEYLISEAPSARNAVDTELFNPGIRHFKRVIAKQIDPALCAQDSVLNPEKSIFKTNIALRAEYDNVNIPSKTLRFRILDRYVRPAIRPLRNFLYTLALLPKGKIRKIVPFR